VDVWQLEELPTKKRTDGANFTKRLRSFMVGVTGRKYTIHSDCSKNLIDYDGLSIFRSIYQRKLANEKIVKAKEDKMNNVSHFSRTYTFIANYSQNLDLPHFGGEQPEDTFYYSPLNIFQFGVVDPTDNNKLHAFVCYEGDGKKGGNNVASLI
jgi:hypothetical protein